MSRHAAVGDEMALKDGLPREVACDRLRNGLLLNDLGLASTGLLRGQSATDRNELINQRFVRFSYE